MHCNQLFLILTTLYIYIYSIQLESLKCSKIQNISSTIYDAINIHQVTHLESIHHGLKHLTQGFKKRPFTQLRYAHEKDT